MDNTELFNVERFSDLKIKLSGGKLLSVHKVVVCRKIEYFDHLCGPNSRFAVSVMSDPDPLESFPHVANGIIFAQESNQEIVKLQDDSPVAFKGLIRWAYGLPALEGATDTCTNWIDVRITADKYLASELSEESLGRFWEHARQIRTGEEILQVVEKITADGSHDVGLVGASERLYGVWFQEILKIPRFREELLGDKERMLGMIDDLSKGRSLTADQRKFLRLHSQFPLTNHQSRHSQRGRR